ncbi:hypothetical protein ACHAXH_002584 [Discostella pseudostelligera]
MKTGKPFLIAGVPIAGLALHSLSSGAGAGVASAWTPPRPTAPPSSSSAASRSSHVGRRHHHARPTSTSSTISSRANNNNNNIHLLFSSTSTNLDEQILQSLHLTPELQMMTQAFASIPDEKTRHKQLLYMASKLPTVNEEETTLRIPENKVPGCLSTVHVDCVVEKKSGVEGVNGNSKEDRDDGEEEQWVVSYFGDSDGLLTKGLLALLIRGLSGCTPEQINAVDPQFIQTAKISQSLTPGRNNGFLNMLAVMKKKAVEAVEREKNTMTKNVGEEGDAVSDTATNGEDLSTSSEASIISSFTPIDGKPMYNAILSTLISTLKPSSITLTDTSHQHAGHAGSKGWEESGESHFELMVVADAFEGLNLVKRHKLIYMLLGEVMPKIHALAIVARSPSEVE